MNRQTLAFSQPEILIVDDTPDNLRLLASMLGSQGYKVRKALNGEIALSTCKTRIPDLILLDIMMPDLDGYEVCKILKNDENTKNIPIIFISALDDVWDKVKAFAVGGVDYISKPFQSEEVLARVVNQLTIQNLQKQLTEQNKHLADLNQNLEKLVEQKTQELIHQEKSAAIGRLTQGMVHNLRNPLSTITLAIGLIEVEAQQIQNQVIIDYCQLVDTASMQIGQIMDNLLLKTYREQAEDLKLLNLNDILREELQLLNANLHFKHKLDKNILLDEEIPCVPLIYSHISQIFHNLINNAIDAMWNQEYQEITIITRQDETNVYMDIKDIGCGIAAENLSKIFDPFYTSKPAKGDENIPGQPTGTGLGLHTCVELLKPFHGEIKVISKEGEGCLFTITIPKI